MINDLQNMPTFIIQGIFIVLYFLVPAFICWMFLFFKKRKKNKIMSLENFSQKFDQEMTQAFENNQYLERMITERHDK